MVSKALGDLVRDTVESLDPSKSGDLLFAA